MVIRASAIIQIRTAEVDFGPCPHSAFPVQEVVVAVAPAFEVVGKPIPRVEGLDKVTGRAQYTADVVLPGTLWAKNVRSPYPHALIGSIDASRALRLPGVRAVLTAADFRNVRIGRRLKDHPVLCDDRVRFVGDKV